MKVIENIEHPLLFNNPVVAIGSFDGVHLGHRKILECVKETAKEIDGESVIITFEPHPQEVLSRHEDFFRINTKKDKIDLLRAENIDNLVVMKFTEELAQTSFIDFLQQILIDKIGVKVLVMGPNHSFGKNREGNFEAISQIAEKYGVTIKVISELMTPEGNVRSRKIREFIRKGELEKARKLLGRK
ncbi:MAG: FAD synthetase family protein [Bacteroidales bacterium]|jgi:riboflavin kinase/FMN adenylyltransferase|nr:FAD synthetase family protein [Bacteroidales bacterium]